MASKSFVKTLFNRWVALREWEWDEEDVLEIIIMDLGGVSPLAKRMTVFEFGIDDAYKTQKGIKWVRDAHSLRWL